jgi:hypothetical protein
VFIDNEEEPASYLYDNEPIAESLLPPVFYAKRGEKRVKLISTSPGIKQNRQNSPQKKTIYLSLSKTTPYFFL